ncbi:Uncharacterized protein PPKH_1632 [Pseudomonas putida]|nr:Uncharacterized protein PPKH_1632 [Pseudomonas putida]
MLALLLSFGSAFFDCPQLFGKRCANFSALATTFLLDLF